MSGAPSLVRRLAAGGYDLLLLAGVLFVTAAMVVIPYQLLTGQPLLRGLPLQGFRLYLVAIALGYYLYFWTDGRQTLGMRAWRLRLMRADGGALDRATALRRLGWMLLCLAPLGLGFWWLLFDRERRTLHDRLSGTCVLLLARTGRRAPFSGG